MSLEQVCRWAGRVVGATVGTWIVAIMLSELRGPAGLEGLNPRNLTITEVALLSVILIGAFGLVVGWRHERSGGILALGAGLVLMAAGFRNAEVQPIWPLGVLFTLPGALYLAASKFSEQHRRVSAIR